MGSNLGGVGSGLGFHRDAPHRRRGFVAGLDVGCGTGDLAGSLPDRARWIGLDNSPAQLAQAKAGPVLRADARRLPFGDEVFGAVVCHWMLYHLDHPTEVITEATGCSAPAASSSPPPRRAPTIPTRAGRLSGDHLDAEDSAAIVASVFGADAIEVEAWDGPFLVLPDPTAVASYVRHHPPPDAADQVTTPLTLTKRGCFVWARKH